MSDDDAPRIRLWGDSTRGHRVHPATAVRPDHGGIDLSTVDLPHSAPRSTTTEPVRATALLELRVVTDDGVPIRDAQLEIVDTGAVLTTDADGAAHADLSEGSQELRFVDPPLVLDPLVGEPSTPTRTILVESHRTEPFTLSTGAPKTVVVRRPRTTEILLDGYAQGSVVMRWGGTRPRLEEIGGAPIPVVGTARGAAAAFLMRAQGQYALVVGHADPQGSDAANAAVAKDRAISTQLYLSGRHHEWAEHAAANAGETDFACALSAFAAILGIDRPALDDADALGATCTELHRVGGIAEGESSPTGTVEEWGILSQAYDLDLAKLLGLDVLDLERLRERITWVGEGVSDLGEAWPRDPVELDAASQVGLPYVLACRRSSLHVMARADADALPDLDEERIDTLYDGTFGRTIVETPTEVLVRIRCTDPKGQLLAGARVWLRGPTGVNAHVADASGTVTVVALRGTRFEVDLARAADNSGTFIDLTKTEIP